VADELRDDTARAAADYVLKRGIAERAPVSRLKSGAPAYSHSPVEPTDSGEREPGRVGAGAALTHTLGQFGIFLYRA
jgi:hypothetical protein